MPIYKEKGTKKKVAQKDFSGRSPEMIIQVIYF